MSELLGKTINGKYRIVRLIGKGGMGCVYEAVHEGLGARVALKALHSDLAKSGLGPRFLQEARAAARIQSVHVVRVSDVDQTEEGLPFMVLEFLEGKTLQALYEHLYKAGERLAYPDALEFAVQICEGVEAAHAAGIVHRDLKPDNVMITTGPKGAPVLKLLDFGIAKLDDKVDPRSVRTRPGVIMGTPEYMAPEQAFAADTADARADIFSLGVMIYEMIAGHRPVGGDEPQEIAVAYLTGNIPRLRAAAPATPPEIDAIIYRAMAAKPADRLSTVRELRETLEPFLAALRPPSLSRVATPTDIKAPSLSLPGTNVYDQTVPAPSGARSALSPILDEATKKSEGPERTAAASPILLGLPPSASPSVQVVSQPAYPSPAYPHSAPPSPPRPSVSSVPLIPPTAVPSTSSGQQWPYGPSIPPTPLASPNRQSSGAIVAVIAIAFFLAIGGAAIWAVYYYTDVFEDSPPAKKKKPPPPAPKPKPTPTPPPRRLR